SRCSTAPAAPPRRRGCSPAAEEIEDERQDDTQEERGCEREVEREVPALDMDVAGQAPDPRHASREHEHHAGKDDEQTEGDEDLAEVMHASLEETLLAGGGGRGLLAQVAVGVTGDAAAVRGAHDEADLQKVGLDQLRQDRKSTRLNSSH